MKAKKQNAAIVGRRLRRFLGALLALGFGAAWWSFVPETKAVAGPVAHAVARKPIARTPIAAVAVTHVPTIRIARLPRHVKPRRKHLVVVPTPPPVIVDVDPTPVATLVVVPVVDPVPVPEPVVDEPVLPHIRTRSS